MPHLPLATAFCKHGPYSESPTWVERTALLALAGASAWAVLWFFVLCASLVE